MESTDCCTECGEVFKSIAQVRTLGQIPCPAEEISGGRCLSGLDQVECTNRAESCEMPVKFSYDESCSLHSDLKNTMGSEPTHFPRCQEIWSTGGDYRKHRCVWDKSECDVGPEEYNVVQKPVSWFDGCSCEHVVTGACRSDDGEYYCAVSRDGCEIPDTYITSLKTAEVGLDCRLCQPKRVLEPPTLFPTTEAHGKVINDRNNRSNVDEDESGSKFAIELILIGSIGGSFLLSVVGTYFYYRNQKDAVEY